jgi:hypothetical protein
MAQQDEAASAMMASLKGAECLPAVGAKTAFIGRRMQIVNSSACAHFVGGDLRN